MTIIIFIFILALLILVHELGHFIAAKKNKVKVEEFGIGFPPRLFGIKKGETLYSLNAIPLGGFVKLYGEEYHELKNKTENASAGRQIKDPKAFINKKPWQKALIIISGVIGNFLLGWIIISYLFTQGVPTPTNKIIVEKVQINSPAEKAGIQKNDVILSLDLSDNPKNQINLKSATDLIFFSKKYAGQSIILTISRKGEKLKKTLTPRIKPPPGEGPLGIVITSFIEKKYPWYQAPFYGLIEAFNITKKIAVEIAKVLFQIISFQKPHVEVAGPVGIARYTGEAIKFGKNAILELTAILSLNLAIINILPFPALDGGRLIFVLYEWITRRRVNQKIEYYVNLFGIIVLLSLAILITFNDIVKLINK